MSKTKILNLLLILSSLIVYLEWGTDQAAFLVETEIEMFSKVFKDPKSLFHPFIVLPLVGQIILIYTLFQKEPGKKLSYAGLAGIGVLVLFICFVGAISMNYKIILSTFPFLITGVLVIKHQRKIRS